jgi:hypothetical protein
MPNSDCWHIMNPLSANALQPRDEMTLEDYRQGRVTGVSLAPEWALRRSFEDFYRNFSGILEDEEWNFKKTACTSDSYGMCLNIPYFEIPRKIPVVSSTFAPNTGLLRTSQTGKPASTVDRDRGETSHDPAG